MLSVGNTAIKGCSWPNFWANLGSFSLAAPEPSGSAAAFSSSSASCRAPCTLCQPSTAISSEHSARKLVNCTRSGCACAQGGVHERSHLESGLCHKLLLLFAGVDKLLDVVDHVLWGEVGSVVQLPAGQFTGWVTRLLVGRPTRQDGQPSSQGAVRAPKLVEAILLLRH